MIRKLKIIKGQALYRDNKYLGMMYILEFDGKKQLHSDNKNIPPIVAYKECKRFIQGEGEIYTFCYSNQRNVKRIIEKLGFKRISNLKNLIAFRKD